MPHTPFHGGFGLVANGVIPKPTFWTFALHRSEDSVIVSNGKDEYRGIIWNSTLKRQGKTLDYSCSIKVPDTEKGEYSIIYRTVDEDVCNPRRIWHDMGEPSSLTKAQKEILKQAAMPYISSERKDASDGMLNIQKTLSEFAVVYFECKKSVIKSDRGYSYDRL